MSITLYGPRPGQPRTPTVAFTRRGVDSVPVVTDDDVRETVVRALAREGLFLSHGDFYAQTAIDRLGVPELVRAGCACYTTEDEVRRLVDAMARQPIR